MAKKYLVETFVDLPVTNPMTPEDHQGTKEQRMLRWLERMQREEGYELHSCVPSVDRSGKPSLVAIIVKAG